jgi:hypothetical protein
MGLASVFVLPLVILVFTYIEISRHIGDNVLIENKLNDPVFAPQPGKT